MFRALFLALCFAFAMGMPDHSSMENKRPPLMAKVQQCCVKDLYHVNKEMFKECFQMDMKPHTCDIDICIATKKGYASSDGTIDKKALQETAEKDFKDNTVALEAILENCVNGDLSKFGKEDACELMKINRCIELQVIKTCDVWKEGEDCKKLKTSVDSIIQQYE